jgi:lipopolysaccharide export system permease protein
MHTILSIIHRIRNMNLYSRHTIKKISKGSLISVSSITLIISSITFLNELGLSKIFKILDAFVALKYFLLSIIPITIYIMPISTCCAALYIYHNMATDRELDIWQSVGLNKYQIAKPAIKFAVLITIMMAFFTMFIIPITKKHIRTSIEKLKNTSSINTVLEEKSFNRLSANTTLYAEKISKDENLEGVVVYTKEKDGNNSITVAEKARTIFNKNTTSFRLYNGNRHTKYSGSQQTIFFKTLIVNTPSNTNAGRANAFDSLGYLTAYDLFKLQKPERFNELIARTVWPLSNLILIMLSSSILLSAGFSRQTPIKPLVYSFAFPTIVVIILFILRQKVSHNLLYAAPIYTIVSLSILASMSILKENLHHSYLSKKLQKIVK